MNKNTGDGELDDIVAEVATKGMIGMQLAMSDGSPDHHKRVLEEAKTAIKKYAAQEANKAKQQLLQELMEQADDHYNGFGKVIPLSVIQNKLEGLS